MSTEKMKVLEMLQQGSITTEEALKLLNHLPNEEEAKNSGPMLFVSPQKPLKPMAPLPPYSMDFSWVSNLRDNISNIARQFDSAFGKDSCLLRSDSLSEIKSLRLSGKNDSVEISGYDGDCLVIEAFYSLKPNADPRISLDDDNGRYALYYDSNAVYALKVIAKVPDVFVDYISAETKNASLRLRDLHFGEAKVSTKNAGITLEDLDGEKLYAETKSASIHVHNLKLTALELSTSSAGITLDRVFANQASLSTSNASVKTRDSDIRKFRVNTSNAGLNLDFYETILKSQYREYSLVAKTTNGSIKVSLPEEIPCKLKATTTAGYISAEREDLSFKTKTKNYVDASSKDYDEDVKKINMELQTSNSNINILNI